jgi:HAD superfamily hydrolase (TIGR01490 family)
VRRIAFFDLDKTLLSANSGSLWIKRELSLGHISRLQALQASLWIFRYHLGFTPMERALERAVRMLHGIPEKEIRDRTSDFYQSMVRGLYRPGGRAAVEEHRSRGDRLVLLTSSSLYMAELVSSDLGLDNVLCNRFEVDASGVHTGRPVGTFCYGAGKLYHAQSFVEQIGEGLESATFYTDSYSDLPVMEKVGEPVAVNPDPRLRREALRRRWRVVDWGQSPERTLWKAQKSLG